MHETKITTIRVSTVINIDVKIDKFEKNLNKMLKAALSKLQLLALFLVDQGLSILVSNFNAFKKSKNITSTVYRVNHLSH